VAEFKGRELEREEEEEEEGEREEDVGGTLVVAEEEEEEEEGSLRKGIESSKSSSTGKSGSSKGLLDAELLPLIPPAFESVLLPIFAVLLLLS
jgi:hypothetical protein